MDGHLRIKANRCPYKEEDRQLKQQFHNGINDDDMMIVIIQELITVRKTGKIVI